MRLRAQAGIKLLRSHDGKIRMRARSGWNNADRSGPRWHAYKYQMGFVVSAIPRARSGLPSQARLPERGAALRAARSAYGLHGRGSVLWQAPSCAAHFLATLPRLQHVTARTGMFNDQLQLASQWSRGASVERHDTEILVKQAVCARCYWRIARRIVLTSISRAHAHGFPWRD